MGGKGGKNKTNKRNKKPTGKKKKKKGKKDKIKRKCGNKCKARRRKAKARNAKKDNDNNVSKKDKKKKKKRRNKDNKRRKNKKRGRKGKQARKDKKREKRKKKLRRAKIKKQRKNKQRGKSGEKQVAGATCGTTEVSDACLINAVEALNFEKNQIQNFFKQKARLLNHNKTTGNKLSKNMNFNESADYMLKAIGGDISNPKCGENTTVRNSAKLDNATKNYQGLNNCSETIKEACSMPDTTIDSAKLETCEEIFTASKKASEDCRTNEAYTSDGQAACTCWEKAAVGITKAKEEKCSTYGSNTAKAVKAQKKKCIQAFSVCKKLQDAAIQLISVCMSGEVNA